MVRADFSVVIFSETESNQSAHLNRGSHETNQDTYVDEYIQLCKNTIHSNLSTSNSSFLEDDIIVDCDGYSVIVSICPSIPVPNGTIPELPSQIKSRIGKLFGIFGSQWGKVKLPSSAIATKVKGQRSGNDCMFGGEQVKLLGEDGHHCLFESEEVVIESPLKVAVHSSCSASIAERLNDLHFPIETSSKPGICLNPNVSVPSFGIMLDVILDSSYVASQNRWIIHFGDIGTRHVIGPDRNECPLTKLFKEITDIRNDSTLIEGYNVTIEVTQMDISFNIPISRKLVRWSLANDDDDDVGHKRKYHLRNHRDPDYSALHGKHVDVWPLHGIETGTDRILPPRRQKGTLRFKGSKITQAQRNPQAQTTAPNDDDTSSDTHPDSITQAQRNPQAQTTAPNDDDTSSDGYPDSITTHTGSISPVPQSISRNYNEFFIAPPNDATDDSNYHDTEGQDLICSIYGRRDESTSSTIMPLTACRDDLHNIKFYSTVSHSLMQNRHSTPLSISKIQTLPKQSFRKLKATLDTLSTNCKRALTYVHDHNAMARMELSIRPGTVSPSSQTLRRCGHLVDIFTLVCHSVTEVFADHSIQIETVTPSETFTKFNHHVDQIKTMLQYRNSKIFEEVYSAVDASQWLIANICYAMTLCGYAHMSKTRHINQFFRNPKFDPFGFKRSILPNDAVDTEGECLSENHPDHKAVINALQTLLVNIPLSQDGKLSLEQLVSQNQELSTRELFHSLTLRDKLILAYECSNNILPNLSSQLLSKEILTQSDNTHEVFHPHEYLEDFFDYCYEHTDEPLPISDSVIQKLFDREKYCNESTKASIVAMHLGHPRVSAPEYVRKHNSLPNQPILYAIFKLVELCNVFSSKSEGFITKLSRYINLCHRHRMILPFSNEKLNSLPNDVQLTSTTSVVELRSVIRHTLNIPHIASNNKDVMLKELANHYFFPCDYTPQFPTTEPNIDTFSRDEQDLNVHLHTVWNDGQSIELPHFFTPNTQRYYRDNTDDVVVIPLQNYVFKPDPHNRSLKNQLLKSHKDSSVHTNLITCLRNVLFPNYSTNEQVYQVLDSKFSSLEICDYFTDSQARVLEQFRPFLNWESAKIMRQNNENKYFEKILIPAISLILRTHIAFINDGVIHLYYYQNLCGIVVQYKTRTATNMIPNQELNVTFVFKKNDRYCGGVRPQIDTTPPANDIFNFATHHNDMQHLTAHPNGAAIQKSTLALCLREVLRSDSYKHDQFWDLPKVDRRSKDPLQIHDFISELAFQNVSFVQCFDQVIVDTLPSLQILNFSALYQQMSESEIDISVEPMLLVPIVCLKYKLFVCLYRLKTSNHPHDRYTNVYYFNIFSKKVSCIVIPKLVYFPRYEHIIYLSISNPTHDKSTYKFWNMKRGSLFPQKTGDYMNLLRTAYSYPDGKIIQHAFEKLRHIGIHVHPASEISNLNAPQQIQCVAIPALSDSGLLNYATLVIFPFDQDVYPTLLLIHDNVVEEYALVKAVELTDAYVSNHLHRKYHLSLINTGRIANSVPMYSSISTTFMYSYIASKSVNTDDFIEKFQIISQLDQIIDKWMTFLSDLCTTYDPSNCRLWSDALVAIRTD